MNGFLKQYGKNKDGTTAVEFALIAAVFLVLIFGIIDAGRLFMTWNAFQRAVEIAGRHVTINPDAPIDEISDLIASNMGAFLIDADTVNVSVVFSTQSNIDFAQIDVAYPFQPLLGWMPYPAVLEASSRMALPQ